MLAQRSARFLAKHAGASHRGKQLTTCLMSSNHSRLMPSTWDDSRNGVLAAVARPGTCNVSQTIRYMSSTTENETKATEEIKDEDTKNSASEPTADAREQQADAGSSEPQQNQETVSKEEELQAQVKDLKDKLLRSLAEQENTRQIASRDIESARQFAIKSFAKSLLDVSDNLSRALEAVPEDARKDKEGNPVLATLYEGIELTSQGLNKAFEMNGLEKYGKEGELFDPNKHDALYEYVDPNKNPGTIGQVMKPGFLLNKRVLRPAEVGVVKKE